MDGVWKPVVRGVSAGPPADTPVIPDSNGSGGSLRVAAMEIFAGRLTVDAGLNVYVFANSDGLRGPSWLWGTPAAADIVEAGAGLLMTLPISHSPDLLRESFSLLFPVRSASAPG